MKAKQPKETQIKSNNQCDAWVAAKWKEEDDEEPVWLHDWACWFFWSSTQNYNLSGW